MRTYFLIKTTSNEYTSSYKYIAESYKEAEQVLLTGRYTDWYTSKGCGSIVEVDEAFNVKHTYRYWNGELDEIDYKKVKK